MKEIIANPVPRNTIELQYFQPSQEKYYAAFFNNLGEIIKGIIVPDKYIHDFDIPAVYTILSKFGFCRHSSYLDFAPYTEPRTLVEYIELLHTRKIKVFEFDTFKEMTDWLNSD